MNTEKISIFWFRRDLRLEDNHGLLEALNADFPVLPIFIIDEEITNELAEDDARITFIYDELTKISSLLKTNSSSLYCVKGNPINIWGNILNKFNVQSVYANEDYEPYAKVRDEKIKTLLDEKNISFTLYKDQVIFAKNEVLKKDNTPYTVFTPYKNKWLSQFKEDQLVDYSFKEYSNFAKTSIAFPSITTLGFKRSSIKVHDYRIDALENYEEVRNFPAMNKTSYLSPHLRFGTVSVRKIVKQVSSNQAFFNELIWREFFMQILYYFPKVVTANFRSKFDHINWRNNTIEFVKWQKGKTGYPMVDAGMRELNATGYMHNRVRMVVAGFLCKHLLIDWRWGEAYFAEKLLDYELSANNGNWQWAAGTGCDAAPYFRIFNPTTQVKKFDPNLAYIKKWIPELNSFDYPTPIIEHKIARERAIKEYKKGIASYMDLCKPKAL